MEYIKNISLYRYIRDKAYFTASASSTCLFFSKSILLPAIRIIISLPTILRNSFTQVFTLLNDSASVIS